MNTGKERFVLILLAALTVIFFFPVLFLGKTFYFRDLTFIFHPWRALCSQAVQCGEMPLWDPYAFCGMPLLANWQSAVFYPFDIFFYTFRFPAALKLFHYTQLFTAGYFAYLFGRKEFGGYAPALAVMILFTFNGFVITKLEFLSYIGVISWTFAVLLFRDRPVLLGLALLFSFLSGHQVFAFQVAALMIFLLFDNLRTGNGLSSIKGSVRNILAAALLSMGLAACQLLPTLELIANSARRKEGIDYSIAMLHSIGMSNLLSFISPVLYKAKFDLVAGEYLQWDTTMFIGIAGITLAMFGLFSRAQRRNVILSVVLILTGILLAMGNKTPVYPWLYRHFFIFHTMRYPVQYAYFSVIGFVILAGIGTKRVKYAHLLILLAAAELLVLCSGFQPLARNDFFYRRSGVVEMLQRDPGNNRFILSPGTEKDRLINASSVEEGWQNARGRLYNLTCLPYRLPNAYGFGEPLTTSSIETAVNRIYTKPDAQAALEGFKTLGVGYLLCKNKLENSAGYELLSENPLYVYKVLSNKGIYEVLPGPEGFSLLSNTPGQGGWRFKFEASAPKRFIWKESLYPGWELFLNGRQAPVKTNGGIFPVFDIPAGVTNACYIYRPGSFLLGLPVTLGFMIFLSVLGYRALRSRFNE